MWRYIKGVEEPAKKRKSEEEKREYNKEYEQKRKRAYSTEWEIKHTWLTDTADGMICTVCKEFSDDPKTNSFVLGCTSYKLDSVIKHERSKNHEKSMLLKKAKTEPKTHSQAAKIIQTLNKENMDKLTIMFRNCHAMIKHNRPITDFNWLCELDELKGLQVGQTYRNTSSARSFIDAIAEVEFMKVSSVMQKAKFVCAVGDGSTDASVQEQEMWYLRTCISGTIVINFLGVATPERATAENIVCGIKDLIKQNLGLDYTDIIKKTVALSCDGASVMVGCRNGVSALLKNDQPCLVTLHCMAHRLELSLKDAAKNVKLYEKTISTLTMGLYYFYHNSPLNRAMLRRSYAAAVKSDDGDTDKLMMPTRAGGTRWIGHVLGAVSNLITSYKFIVTHLGQLTEPVERVSVDSKGRAHAFLKLLQSKDVVCFLMFLKDVLEPLRLLSLQLQDRTSTISKQYSALSSTLEVLGKYKTSDGPNLRKVVEKNEFQGVSLKWCNIQEFKAARVKLLDLLIVAIDKRFKEFCSDDHSVVLATRIADLDIWPKTWESLKDFGDKDLQTVIDHFEPILRPVIDVSNAELEWMLMKKEMFELDLLSKDWGLLNQQFNAKYQNILHVIDLIMSISPSSSEAERGFSQLKLVKTNIRTKLNQNSLNNCLCIKLLSPDVSHFNPIEAINYWNMSSVRSRRPMLRDRRIQRDFTFKLVSEVPGQPQFESAGPSTSQVSMTSSPINIQEPQSKAISEKEKYVNEVLDKMEQVAEEIDECDSEDSDSTLSDDELNEDQVFSNLMCSD